jgi:hypothetical protein
MMTFTPAPSKLTIGPVGQYKFAAPAVLNHSVKED